MRVIHNIYKLGRASFGVGEVVRFLARAQARTMEVAVVSQDGPQEDFHPELAAGVRLHRLPDSALARLGFHPAYFTRRGLRRYDVVHQHSSWMANGLFSVLASYSGAKVVYTPHGTLAPEALRQSRLKKRVALALYERWLLRRSAAVQALSLRELEDVRRFGVGAPVAVIPNGVDDFTVDRPVNRTAFRERLGLPGDRKVLLFLGRVNPIKGLDLLLPLLGQNPTFRASWMLVLTGPTEEPFLSELKRLVQEHHLEDLVRFTGSLFGEDKLDAYDGCDAFVLPSRSEAMPMVVLEAMARRKPVLVTEVTPIREIEEKQAGLRTGLSLEERRRGLETLLAMTDEERQAMGERGHSVVASTYRWTQVSAMTQQLYTWLLDPSRPRPVFVFLADQFPPRGR